MLHLLKYSFLSKVRNFNIVFWPLVFPLVLGTFFYFAFGNINDADFQTVPAAVVKEDSVDIFFMTYLDEVKKSNPDLLKTEEMTEKEALKELRDKKIKGIYYVGKEPSLTVAGTGMEESILQTVLDSCENTRTTITNIMEKNPQMDMETITKLLKSDSLVKEVSLGGRTINGDVQFFYALIAMACLYGCFIGFGSAIGIQADITPLAARRCVTPTHKLKLILTEQLTSFALGYADVIILLLYLRYVLNLDFQGQMEKMLVVSLFGSLIGVSMGMFIGSLGKMQEGARIGIMLGISMVSSFLAGLMNGNMKDIVEKSVPFVNRINPASLISDAFYCINVYDDTARYYRSLVTLAVMCVVLVMASFFMVRRERYDSI
nr:ABC transporter permease [uncultured Blautia sp.]